MVHSNPGRAACAFAVAGGTPAFPETRTMTRRGVLDPTRTDRSVRSVAILDTNSGENVDALLLVYPNDDASVVARCRAMKGLILALRGATRSLSGRDATCATLGAGDEEGGAVRVGLADLARTGSLLAVETTFAEDARAARLAATTAEHVRFLHGDSWVDRLREERDARRDGAADATQTTASEASEASAASDADGNQTTPHSTLLADAIASFLRTRAAWEPARVVARVDPGIRAALCAAETATRPLAERLGGAAPFADLKPGAMFILAGRRRRRRRKRRPGLPRRRVHRPGVAPTSRRHREARRVRIARSDWVVGASRSVGLDDDDGVDERPTKTTGGDSSDAALSWRGRRPSRRA